MEFPIDVRPKLINSGVCNAESPHCIALTYYQGQQIIAYGSGSNLIIATSTLAVLHSLSGHQPDQRIISIAWAPYSGQISSADTDGRIIFWIPDAKEGWKMSAEIKENSNAMCMSWSICDHIFCVCLENELIIYNRTESPNSWDHNVITIAKVYAESVKASFCSFSRDSRFILTIQDNSKEIVLYHRREHGNNDYCRLPLYHPSPVRVAEWRIGDQLHERCCFLTVADDKIVRIWSETSVHEKLAFSVIIAIPATYNTISAAFISTSSRLVSTNPLIHGVHKPRADTYAFGHGHLPKYDLDTRQARLPSQQELNRNHYWLLTFDAKQNVIIWELSGISSNIRRTPSLTRLEPVIPLANSNIVQVNRLFAFCRLESEFSHFADLNFVGKPDSLTLIMQNNETKLLTTIDISLKRHTYIRDLLHGHEGTIETIRVHSTKSLMVSLDSKGDPFLWRFDDTDVYDPTVLIKFIYQLKIKLAAVDWCTESSQLIGYDHIHKNIMIIQIPNAAEPIFHPNHKAISVDWKYAEKPICFRVECDLAGGIIFFAMFKNDLHIMWLYKDQITELKHVHSEVGFVYAITVFISRLFPIKGASITFVAEKNNNVYCAVLNSSIVDTNNLSSIISYDLALKMDEEIKGLCISHPGFLFIATKRHLYVARRKCSSVHSFTILQTIDLDYEPSVIECIPTGLVSIAGGNRIDFYYPVRKQTGFTESIPEWQRVSKYIGKSANTLEWTLDGILIYSSKNQIYAFTKFMDTYFLQGDHLKLPTIHHSLAQCMPMVPDFHPAVLIPLTISGRFTLVANMIKYLNENYDEKDNRIFYIQSILQMPKEIKAETLINDESVKTAIGELAKKFESNPLPEYNEKEVSLTIKLLNSFNQVLNVKSEAADNKALIIARAMAIWDVNPIPFDLICTAYLSQDQNRLIEMLSLDEYEKISATGIFYWGRDLNEVYNAIVPFAIRVFEERKYMSIILLTVTKRFRILKQLFSKVGDDTRAQFFMRDFSDIKERKFAEKNGYSALKKQDYHIACAMFILADQVQLAIRIIIQNLNDYGLAYLIARSYDNGIGNVTAHAIKEIYIPLAEQRGDMAAVLFFQYVMEPEKNFSYEKRISQTYPGFFIPNSIFFGDMRFCVCEVINSTIDHKSDTCLALLMSGQYLLATQYLPYFTTFVLNTDEPNPTHENSYASFTSKSLTFDVNGTAQITSQGSNPIFVGNGFGTIVSDSEDEEDEVDEIVHKEEFNSFSFGFSGGGSFQPVVSDTESDEEEEEDSDEIVQGGDIKEVKSNSSFRTLKSGQFKLSEPTVSTRSFRVDAANNPMKRDENSERLSFANSLSSGNMLGFNLFKANGNEYEEMEEGDQEDQQEKSIINWFTIVITFNICRYRLEAYLETQHQLTKIDESIVHINPEIIGAGPHTASMLHQLEDYLIRTCKRRCFVFRRLLLLTTQKAKYQYLFDLCKNLSLLPDQMMSYAFTSQQITQIAQTVVVIIRCINQDLIPFDDTAQFPHTSFIIASVATALFMIAFFYHNVNLMKLVLKLNLNDIKTFPENISEYMQINQIEPCQVQYHLKKVVFKHQIYHFITDDIAKMFYIEKPYFQRNESLTIFASFLTDFMLVDTFLRNIAVLADNSNHVFQSLLQFLKKMNDIYLQLLSYGVLSYPQLLHIQELNDIKIEGHPEYNELLKMLNKINDRNRIIPIYCTNIFIRFSDVNTHHDIPTPASIELSTPMIMNKKFRNEVKGICWNAKKSIIVAACSHSIKEIKPTDIHDYEYEEDVTESSVFINSEIGVGIQSTPMKSEFEYPEPSEEAKVIETTFKVNENKMKIDGKTHVCICSHPVEAFTLHGNENGQVWLRSIDNPDKGTVFDTPNMRCNDANISQTGSMIGACHGSKLSLWSLSYKETRSKPCTVIDTYSERALKLQFLQGAGLVTTIQLDSSICKANVVFWDSLMPNFNSMVASIKIKEQIGEPTCMCYSPNYSQIYVGTQHGMACSIDIRKFEVCSYLKPADGITKKKGIYAIAINNTQTCLATGSASGSLKIWDICTSQLLKVMKEVHHPKTSHYYGTKTLGITDIVIRDNDIYTSGVDGYVKCVKISY